MPAMIPTTDQRAPLAIHTRVCQFQGCGREYKGHSLQKYCELHNTIKKRGGWRPVYNIENANQIFDHSFTVPTKTVFTCALDGCRNTFEITVYPSQRLYPVFCEEHRQEHRRAHFTRMHRERMSVL